VIEKPQWFNPSYHFDLSIFDDLRFEASDTRILITDYHLYDCLKAYGMYDEVQDLCNVLAQMLLKIYLCSLEPASRGEIQFLQSVSKSLDASIKWLCHCANIYGRPVGTEMEAVTA
jgi:hypothetical protein